MAVKVNKHKINYYFLVKIPALEYTKFTLKSKNRNFTPINLINSYLKGKTPNKIIKSRETLSHNQ